MNNKTIEEIKIKRRGDGVYDIYFNKEWIASRGTYIGAFEEIKRYIHDIDNIKEREHKQI